MSRERESEAREVLAHHLGGLGVSEARKDRIVAAMLEFATLLQAAREDAASGMPPMAAAAIRKGLWDADEHVQGRLRVLEALRERCARVADAEAEDIERHGHLRADAWQSGRSAMARTIATAIRAIEIKGEEG